MTHDPNCLFCRIVRGEIPAVQVFEDEDTIAFMDIFPQSRGHTLVIPKNARARNFLDLPPSRVAPFMERVHFVARAVEKALEPDGLSLLQFTGAPAGQTVFHLHFHVLPRFDGVDLRPHTGKMADHALLAKHAEMIRAALG